MHTEGEEENRGGRKMQSAKNRLEMAVSPQAKQTFPHGSQTDSRHIKPN